MYHQEHLLHLIILVLRTCTVVAYFIIIFNACLLCSYSTMCLATHGFLSVNNVLTSSSCCLTFPHGFHTSLTVLLTVSICDNGQVHFFKPGAYQPQAGTRLVS